jgi:hypothetical protein
MAGCIEGEGRGNGILNRDDMVKRAGQGCSAFTKPAWYPGGEPGIIMRRCVDELIEMAHASIRHPIFERYPTSHFVLRA